MTERGDRRALTPWAPRILGALGLGAICVGAGTAQQPDVERWVGGWRGTLRTGSAEFPVVFHVSAGPAGLSAAMDSPAQGAFGVPMDEVAAVGDTLRLVLRSAGAGYRGVLREDGTLAGTWTQGAASLPLDLERVHGGGEPDGERTDASGAPARERADRGAEPAHEGVGAAPAAPDPAARPQTPAPPFPYRAEEVRFPNRAEAFELAGTLTLPEGAGPFPGVVLISGSGPQDRDESLMGHKPFAVLADHLTRSGIAVLRYDDRGVGGSGGDFASATSVELAGDAEAALAWLAARPEVDGERVGMVGHSEGGLIAPMVAARNPAVAFVVLLAGTGMTGAEIILDQSRRIALAEGMEPERVERSLEVNRALFQVVREEGGTEAGEARMRQILNAAIAAMTPGERTAAGLTEASREAWVNGQLAQLRSPWLRHFLGYDPVPALEATRVPVLALNGELDLQVPHEGNLAAIRAALARGGNPDYAVEALPGLNHLFQTAGTGSPREYAHIEETMSPRVLERVSGWILARFGGG
ncbi:MAG: CocE/NonD family hydrolase [Longimicrobiales bacterium]|nr:CocE/NonD family hydrolase [Longimicrobiales bacterium]